MASCFILAVDDVVDEVVRFVEPDLELLFVLEVLLPNICPTRLLLALLKFLALNNEFLELFIFILHPYPFRYCL